ncbi:MAG: orotate phosphoribosyltransferase [Ignavibacteriae bacterium]|nr:MAG: orotate phosphoribosyltransferase [Ignavibacteriota bacterium]
MDEQILKILKDSNALLEGHFILTSGLHSPHYIEKFRVLEQPKYTEMLCSKIADNFRDKSVTVVIGPITGGIILAYETGKQLGTRAIFTERIDGVMTLRRGFQLSSEDRVLIVEDIITTGGSVQEVIDVVRSCGSDIVGLSCIVDRSNGKAKFDVPYRPLLRMEVVNYNPEECPMCKAGSTTIKPGSTNK